jgi:outer membrane protein OmpA-like peptidoglycan-associated protein
MNNQLPTSNAKQSNDYWISLSDMMTSLMMVFLLIAVIYMIKVQDSVQVPQIYKETKQGLKDALNKEFESDLKRWGAVIDKDLTIRFQQPDLLFSTGSAELSSDFRSILDDFFPRYLKIMMDEKFVNNIEEIRIEGHTSSKWRANIVGDEAYINNMQLSQARTVATLVYILTSNRMRLDDTQKEWLRKHFRAIGYSSAKPLNSDGFEVKKNESENSLKSQRVEFRIRTNIEERVSNIVDKKHETN